jgi:hypothetical protein
LDLIGLCLDLAVTRIDGLGAQLQAIECRVSRQRFAFVSLQYSILSERMVLAAD